MLTAMTWLAGLLLALGAAAGFLWIQGRSTRARVPRLAEAPGPRDGVIPGPEPGVSVAVLGESPVAGVGLPNHESGLAGRAARELHALLDCRVVWRALGVSGLTAGRAGRLVTNLEPHTVDIVIVVLGVNDTLRLRAPHGWRRDLVALVDVIAQRVHPRLIVIAGVPPLSCFPALPAPLRWLLGLWGWRLDREARALAARMEGVRHVSTGVHSEADFCADGFHPGPEGHARWGRGLAEEIVRVWGEKEIGR